MSENNYPLVTFAIIAYNQENFIAEAVNSAFEQTYPNLEIILSDDNSSDRTFEILKEMSLNYAGPHRVVLNKNIPNLGIGKHMDKVMSLASYDSNFIVINAGDDISVPERTSIFVNDWINSNREIKCFGSDYESIDLNGNSLGVNKGSYKVPNNIEALVRDNSVFGGSTGAYDLMLYREFPEFVEHLVNEDRAFPLRCMLINSKFKFIHKPLVKYRIGGISGGKANPFYDIFSRSYLTVIMRQITDYEQKIVDINYCQPENKELLITECQNQINILKIRKLASQYPYSFVKILKQAKNKEQRIQAYKLIARNIFPFINAFRLWIRSK